MEPPTDLISSEIPMIIAVTAGEVMGSEIPTAAMVGFFDQTASGTPATIEEIAGVATASEIPTAATVQPAGLADSA